ncbi:MAG: hypothetical protein COV95_00065, partial [Candidatus Zambryskibacteria bacterium CG11_big_fil_rev_8_21_14_0_20_40_24]
SLRQAFAHCGRFSTAATRRCMDRVSVPSVGNRLSPPLAVIALVGHYPTNKLIARRPLLKRIAALVFPPHRKLPRLSASYARLKGAFLRITTSFAGDASHQVDKLYKLRSCISLNSNLLNLLNFFDLQTWCEAPP